MIDIKNIFTTIVSMINNIQNNNLSQSLITDEVNERVDSNIELMLNQERRLDQNVNREGRQVPDSNLKCNI